MGDKFAKLDLPLDLLHAGAMSYCSQPGNKPMTAEPPRRDRKPRRRSGRVKSETEIAIANRCDGKECPPKSAKLVADLDMGSNRALADLRIYSISPNRDRSAWVLWLRREDEDGGPLYVSNRSGPPYHGYQGQFCARISSYWLLATRAK